MDSLLKNCHSTREDCISPIRLALIRTLQIIMICWQNFMASLWTLNNSPKDKFNLINIQVIATIIGIDFKTFTHFRALREKVLAQAVDGAQDDGLYRGMNNYTDHRKGFRREHTIGAEKGGGSHGPLRAPTNIRMTVRFDYQPDICKVRFRYQNSLHTNRLKHLASSLLTELELDCFHCLLNFLG